jgi:hypothetical protein
MLSGLSDRNSSIARPPRNTPRGLQHNICEEKRGACKGRAHAVSKGNVRTRKAKSGQDYADGPNILASLNHCVH